MLYAGFDRKTISGIHCVVGGKGPPVLLLHGYPQSLAMWAKVAPILSETYTVVCADLRGYGDSKKPVCAPDNANYSFRAMADDQVEVMKALGFAQFHVVGHDRGARTAHRMALDHPETVKSLAVLDIAPTYTMFMECDRKLAALYWHWSFLALPAPFPETLIGADPDFYFEHCLLGWGAQRIEDFDAEIFAEYRRAWRSPEMIHGSCSDYRAGATVDLALDTADLGRRIICPTLVFWGSKGLLDTLISLPDYWGPRCTVMRTATLPGGHFFTDQFGPETAAILKQHLDQAGWPASRR